MYKWILQNLSIDSIAFGNYAKGTNNLTGKTRYMNNWMESYFKWVYAKALPWLLLSTSHVEKQNLPLEVFHQQVNSHISLCTLEWPYKQKQHLSITKSIINFSRHHKIFFLMKQLWLICKSPLRCCDYIIKHLPKIDPLVKYKPC